MAYLMTKNLSYRYEDGTKALDDVSIDIEKGDFVGFLASNGGGKTTLLKTIVGLLKPRQGSVLIGNRPISEMGRHELSSKIGFVLQNPNDQLFASTVEEDIAFGPRNQGLNEDEVANRVQETLDLVDLQSYAKKPIHRLSFGQQKRVCIAGVLAMKPEILLLDEPTAGLDPKSESNILRVLGRLNKEQGITVVIATHMVDLMPLFLDRIYVLKEGRLVMKGTPKEIFSSTQAMEGVDLRLPYIARLVEELKYEDALPFSELPLTVKDARIKLIALIPKEVFKLEPK